MNNDEIKALNVQSQMEQAVSLVEGTATRTAMYFKVLINNGIPERIAARMAEQFNLFMLRDRFGKADTYINFFVGDDGDPEQD